MANKYIYESVRGLSQLKQQFKALPDITREAMADAAEETAEQMRAGAVRRVHVRFGFLRDFIAVKMNRKTGVAVVGIKKGTVALPGGGIAKPQAYARLVEFGTTHSGDYPFMIPAAEEQRLPYLQRARAAGKVIERNMAALGARFT